MHWYICILCKPKSIHCRAGLACRSCKPLPGSESHWKLNEFDLESNLVETSMEKKGYFYVYIIYKYQWLNSGVYKCNSLYISSKVHFMHMSVYICVCTQISLWVCIKELCMDMRAFMCALWLDRAYLHRHWCQPLQKHTNLF